jgi:hypothetical protein
MPNDAKFALEQHLISTQNDSGKKKNHSQPFFALSICSTDMDHTIN